MQTRATLALSMHMRYIQFWKILCCPLVLKVIYKVFCCCCFCLIPLAAYPLPRPKNFLYKELIINHSWPWGMRERESVCVCGCICICRWGRGRGPLPKYNKMASLDMKSSCQGPVLNFNCTTLGKKKKKKKGVSFENEATLQVKVGGLFSVSVTLLLAA